VETDADRYTVSFVPIDTIAPSPENDDIYGAIEHDEQMESLIDSIRRRGLEEPIIVTSDGFIVSGHRRYFACCQLGLPTVPVRVSTVSRETCDDYHRLLTEFNPQRIKTASSLLKEALLRTRDEDATELLYDHRRASVEVEAQFMDVRGHKSVRPVSDKKRAFLNAAVRVIEDLREYWPLSIRQVHYRLLNNPPLISEPKRSKFDSEHYRYQNDKTSYDALVELLRQARYTGEVSMTCVDDPTRPQVVPKSYDNVSQFIHLQFSRFLVGYHRSPQLDQPRHIEVLGEKNTLMQILKPICLDYYVPLSLGRGYGSIPVWRDMSARFAASGKDAFTLVIASDYDPEGFDLADDAIRSLRDCFDVDVDYHRIAVTREQIDELDLAVDFNPAKETSSRIKSFVERTGGKKTWELEALPPQYVQEQLRAAIEANMDMEQYEASVKQMQKDAQYLAGVRAEIAGDFSL